MPNAVAHILTPILILAIYRDYIAKKKFPLKYILLAGIGGILPDIDVVIYWILNAFTSVPLTYVHRAFSHTLLVPAALLIIAAIAYKLSKTAFWTTIALTFGYVIHLTLDFLLTGTVKLFYPISSTAYGLELIPKTELGSTIVLGIDAILLTVWLIYDFSKHNIKDFI